MGLPNVVEKLNKAAGKTKIAFLSDAKALHLKRAFSGSLNLDRALGGGVAFKRVQLYFGEKSAGKNATLNQMMAYNQRLCRFCGNILDKFYDDDDRHAQILRYVLGKPRCNCEHRDENAGRVFLFIDYEKTLSMDNEPKVIKVPQHISKSTKEVIDGTTFLEQQVIFDELKEKKKLVGDEKIQLATLEDWFADIETSFLVQEQMGEKDYLRACGVLDDRLLVFAPPYLEDGIDIMRDMIQSKEVDGIIWDSLQAAMPKYVADRSAEDATMGTEAKQNGLLMRQIISSYAPGDITDEREAFLPPVFLTAQVRANLGFLHAKDNYSGGKSVEHIISTAVRFQRIEYLNGNGEKITKENRAKEINHGQVIGVTVEKNKIGVPLAKTSFNYYFKSSDVFPTGFIDYQSELVQQACDLGIINVAHGGNYTYGELKIKGNDNLMNAFRQDPELCKRVLDDLKGIS